jgi:hypothetical protein
LSLYLTRRPLSSGSRLQAVALAAFLSACDPSSQDAFTRGLAYNPCIQSLYACAGGLTATCELNSTMYAQAYFPGSFRFMAPASAGNVIDIWLYLVSQRDAGTLTTFAWYEPGCTDAQTQMVAGVNLFDEAQDTHTVDRSAIVSADGDHLVEIQSDMQATALVNPRIHAPGN